MQTVNTTERLKGLRKLMREHKLNVYIVPSEDSHQSEYIAPCDARREYICGFSGSAGTAVITLDKAALATDGRYFNQASKQLDNNWELLKQGLEDVPTWQEWAADQSEGNKAIGVDPTVITAPEARNLHDKLKKKGGAALVGVKTNLVDLIWGDKRPSRPKEKVKPLPLEFAGKGFEEKIGDLRKELGKKKSAGFIVSMLDEVAWLFNLRGNDIPYNPVFFSYAIITPSSATLYVDSEKLSPEVRSHLDDKVQIRPYDAILEDTKMLSSKADGEHGLESKTAENRTVPPKRKFLISTKASWALSLELGGKEKVEELRSPVEDAKAIKNDTELEGMRACHIRDGAALSEFFAWLEEELIEKGAKIDEVQAADKLEQIRSKNLNFVGLSFDTISSTGPNAAVIHYKPQPDNCSVIDPNAIYLCDSGAQYLDGTTDTTRTLHLTTPTPLELKSYTLVLKGLIALSTAIFPKGTTGFALDTLARQYLWSHGLDYRHGTGHGVGSYLNVHEGPIGIGNRVQYAEVPLAKGNCISDEPGYYEDGGFGVRIENVIVVREVEMKGPGGVEGAKWLGFECVTMVPFCRRLIDEGLLSEKEVKWINAYHREVLEKTKGYFEGDGRTMRWLERECAEMEEGGLESGRVKEDYVSIRV